MCRLSGSWARDSGGVPEWQKDDLADWQAERMAAYAAQVASLDASLGRVMDVVRKAGVAENTLVLFLSDNGAAPDGGLKPTTSGFGIKPNGPWRLDGQAMRPGSGPKNMPGPPDTFAAYGLGWANMSDTPLRSTKMTAYEGGIRTPCIASWPAVIRKGGSITHTVGHVMDFMPTFLDIAGVSYPAEFQGRKPLPLEGKSLLPAFRGESQPGHEVLAWRAPQNRALRSGNWKLVESPATKAWELYDLAADGTETTNLAASHPDLVKDLAAAVAALGGALRREAVTVEQASSLAHKQIRHKRDAYATSNVLQFFAQALPDYNSQPLRYSRCKN